MLCARPRSQKCSDKEIDAGHVRDIASVASNTPLKITRPPRSSKARKATWETAQSGLEITAGTRTSCGLGAARFDEVRVSMIDGSRDGAANPPGLLPR